MNEPSSSFLDSLFARARTARPDTARAQFAFETRLLARLREARQPERSGMGLLAWRMIPYLAVVVLGLGLVQMETGRESQEAQETASLQNPETVDLFATFQ
jgi:hypothetical protein